MIAITAVFAVGSVFYALSLPDIYRSEILLAPVAEENLVGCPAAWASSSVAWQAWRALISRWRKSGLDEDTQSRPCSLVFLSAIFLRAHDCWCFMATMPGEVSGTIEIDPELYDEANGQWIREVSTQNASAFRSGSL